jgi:hypothetical protein
MYGKMRMANNSKTRTTGFYQNDGSQLVDSDVFIRSHTSAGVRPKIVNIDDQLLNKAKPDRVYYRLESTPNKVSRLGKYTRAGATSNISAKAAKSIDKSEIPVHIDAQELQQQLNQSRS